MKLNELLKVIDYSYDFGDDEFDCVFYADAVDNKYTRLIDVVRVDRTWVICSFTKFIEKHKKMVFDFIRKKVEKDFAEKLISGLKNKKEWAYAEFYDGGWFGEMLEINGDEK